MSQKRRVESTTTAIDESDRTLCSNFTNVANQLSQFYSQALHNQKLAFDAGQKHAMEKLKEWMTMKLQEGMIVTVADITAYLQDEMNDGYHPSSNASPHENQNEVNMHLSNTCMQTHQSGEGNTSRSLESDMDVDPERSQ